jgi:hypothetical protein
MMYLLLCVYVKVTKNGMVDKSHTCCTTCIKSHRKLELETNITLHENMKELHNKDSEQTVYIK